MTYDERIAQGRAVRGGIWIAGMAVLFHFMLSALLSARDLASPLLHILATGVSGFAIWILQRFRAQMLAFTQSQIRTQVIAVLLLYLPVIVALFCSSLRAIRTP
jgi:uncharacterized membrane-anchored protein